MFTGRIVQRHHQIPVVPADPFVTARVLMHQHAWQRRALALLAVLAACLRTLDLTGLLQLVLHPRVAACATVLTPIPAMEVPHIPARVVASIQINQSDHFIDRRAPMRDLLEPFVDQCV